MESAHQDRFVCDALPPAEQQPAFLFDLPGLDYPEQLNAAVELVDHWVAEGRGARPAIANAHVRWTYEDLKDRSDRIARILVEEEGLVPGNRVFLRGPNSATLFAAWLGILKAGGVVVATMPLLRPGEIAAVLTKAKVSHAIVDSRFIGDYREGADQAHTVRSLLRFDGDYGKGEIEQRMVVAKPGFAPVATHRDDPALIAFTSGTTGEPKGCIHFHRDILAPADSFARHLLAPQPDDIFMTSAPIAFTFGLGATLIFPFRFGASAVTLEQATPPALLDAIEAHRVSMLWTAPTAYKTILGQIDGRDIASLRTCVSAGEHLPRAVWEAWRDKTGLAIVDGIGATEMMHIFISASGGDIRPGATGKAVPGYRACVLDDAGAPLPTPATGRLAVQGPTGCRYLADPRQANYVSNGWNITGDTYRQDEEGYFWYLARSDDMIVSSGYNIGAPEVENALLSHPAVAECAVIGVPCPERGQKVKAFVVLAANQDGDAALTKALQDHVKAAIAPYKYPREIAYRDSLPKTSTGKLQRRALRERS